VLESGGSLFEMADALKVESLLSGSILVVGERARINLQMLNAETGIALWSKSFEVDTQSMSEMISAQGDIAQKVVKAIQVEARLPQPESLAELPTQSFKAHRYFLTARNSYNHQDEEEKWVLIGKALELDPDYADAQLMFANINLALAVTPMEGFTHEEHLQLALTSVDNYIRLEPENAQGYGLKSSVLAARGDWKATAEPLALMHRFSASDAELKYGALVKMSLGDFNEVVRIYEETLLADPSNLYVRGLLMAAHEMAGNQHGARQEYALGNELKTAWWGRTVNVLLSMGRKEPLDPTNTLDDFSPELRHLLNNLHDVELVRRGIKKYTEGMQNAKDDIFYSALAAHSGDTDLANTLMRRSMEKVSTSLFWAWLPVFADVRRTAGFRQLLQDAGVVAYWQQYGWPASCQPHDATFSCH
jgi:tetratricopeptide (TPR) repeat protein